MCQETSFRTQVGLTEEWATGKASGKTRASSDATTINLTRKVLTRRACSGRYIFHSTRYSDTLDCQRSSNVTKGVETMHLPWLTAADRPLIQLEGMFMINEYHMAVINDNDFGLERNTHVQIAIIQLKHKIELDPCMMSPTCSAGVPTGCYDSSHVKSPELAASPPSSSPSSSSKASCPEDNSGLDPKTVAEICGENAAD